MNPPKLFLRFFKWFSHPDLHNPIEGDLMELYDERVKESGKRKADIKFIIDVLLLFRPGIIRSATGYNTLNNYSMYKSYFKIGWRHLLKNKGYSFINIGGLALGLTVAMLIALWIYDELSFDQYHTNYNALVQVMQHQTFDGVKGTQPSLPLPLEDEIRSKYGSDFKHLSMATWTGEHMLGAGDNKLTRIGNHVQEDFPEMLSLKMISGTRNGLHDLATILLSASTAKALFGEQEAMNQTVQIDGKLDAKVTGIYEDLPANTTFHDCQFLSSWELYLTSEDWLKRAKDQWGNNSFQMFGEVAPGANITQISEKIKNAKADNAKEIAERYKCEIFLIPMRDWHLRSKWVDGVNVGGRIQQVWMFGIIGVFVLLLACINFMNLSTARSEKRAKEVGIRMAIGSIRSQLINQFLSESFLVVILAFIAAMALAGLAIPWFNELAGKNITIPWSSPMLWLIGITFIFTTSLLAGSYPSFYLSSFQPVKVLKGSFKIGKFASIPRKVLVVVQFTVSVTLIIGTTIVYQQIQYSKNRPVGYDRDGILMIQMKSPEFYGKYDVLRKSLKDAGAIKEMSESSSPLSAVWSNSNSFNWQGKDPDLSEDFGTIFITPEYGATIGWTIKAGRNLSRDFSTDSSAIVINEAAAKYMGVKDPIGMEVTWGTDKLHIIGVVNDMVTESPYQPVRQAFYFLNFENVSWINLKLNPDKSAHESIAAIQSIFKNILPNVPFDYKFADTEYANKFDAEVRVGKLAGVFAILAIIISCLGLFGLASFVAEQRTKEIGIRKVMGASVAQLWKMLSGEFVVLVVVSCMIASPIAYYFLSDWLNEYEYHTEITWWIFASAGIGALLVTLLTVSFQSIKAALMNPVKALRSE